MDGSLFFGAFLDTDSAFYVALKASSLLPKDYIK
jgi:hypothetical protein